MSRGRQWADDSSVTVKLAAGGSINLAFRGNLFNLTEPERQLISALTDVIQKHEALNEDANGALPAEKIGEM